jgi:hypothetical protein
LFLDKKFPEFSFASREEVKIASLHFVMQGANSLGIDNQLFFFTSSIFYCCSNGTEKSSPTTSFDSSGFIKIYYMLC